MPNFRRWLKNNTDWLTPLLILAIGFVAVVLVMTTQEKLSFFDSVYFSIVTATTVGYGDMSPSTVAGKIIVIFYMLTAIVALGTAYNVFEVRSRKFTENKRRGFLDIKYAPDVVIIGYPTRDKVKEIVDKLQRNLPGCKIVCVTKQITERAHWMELQEVDFVYGPASEKKVLEKANVHKAKNILLLANDPTDPDSDEYTSSAVMICEIINPDAHTIAEKVRENDDLFKLASCDKIVNVCRPSELAQEILTPGAIDLIDTLFSANVPGSLENVKYEGEAVAWEYVVQHYIRNNQIALGLAEDGQDFLYAPDRAYTVKDGTTIKVLTK
jgi:voltage-gated potassium channel